MTKKEKEQETPKQEDPLYNLKEEIVRIAEIAHAKSFSAGIGSNYSIRTGKDEMLITPSGVNKAWMVPEDIIHVKFNGEIIEGSGRYSSEFPMHVWIYKELPENGAIIHSNPPFLTAFAIAGKGIDTAHLTEPYLQLGDYIPLVHYATPSTDDLAAMFRPYLQPQRKIYLMQNHGVVVLGRNMVDAYNNMSMAENYAHIMSLFGLPSPRIIDKTDLKLLNETFRNKL